MKEILTFSLLIITLKAALFAQKPELPDFQSPLNVPLYLSGNFGELRSGHFHAGIDLKTQSVVGKPVLAAASGYISRIKIQSGGYGKSLYITHPNGYTTLYAHLSSFEPGVERYVRHHQYLRKSYEIELFPVKGMFGFNVGELIAYSGNTGRSGGPHLHFEIRKTAGQIPLNGLHYDFVISDSIPPVFKNLYTYTYKEGSNCGAASENRMHFPLQRINDSTYTVSDTVLLMGEEVGFATEVYDYLNGSANRCGVYQMELYVEKELNFSFQLDEIPFNRSRYINAHMDYELKKFEGKSVHRLFSLPHNNLAIYRNVKNDGILKMEPDSVYAIMIKAVDAYGNASFLQFDVKNLVQQDSLPNPKGSELAWAKGGDLTAENLHLSVPAAALYRNANIDIRIVPGHAGVLTDTFLVHSAAEALHKPVQIKLHLPSDIGVNAEKLLFASINEDGEPEAEGGDYTEGILRMETRSFGKYILVLDTLAPQIKPVSFISGRQYMASDTISFEITDDLSGIDSYTAYINNEWALFSYDAKSGHFEYVVDSEYLNVGGQELLIKVVDLKGNQAEFKGTFKY